MKTKASCQLLGGARAWRSRQWVMLTLVLALLTGCSAQSLLTGPIADQLARQGASAEDDLVLAREASGFYLKLSESVLTQSPGHLPLAEAVAAGFTQYAYAFVAFEADRIEERDARTAQRLRQRAATLYWRAHRHAIRALEQHSPQVVGWLSGPADRTAGPRPDLPASQVGVAYWAAAAWGAHIALSKDRPDVVADLPRAIALARLAWDVDPDHGAGALASLMGSFEAARPGGTRTQAKAYFDRALQAAAGRSAGPHVAIAETLALADGDRAAFESLLRQAIDIGTAHPDLGNKVMQERAQWLLDTAADRF